MEFVSHTSAVPLLSPQLRELLSESECHLLSEIELIPNCFERWKQISKSLLTPSHPWSVHYELYHNNYLGHDIAPSWIPELEQLNETNIAKLMTEREFSTYHQFYLWSIESPEEFWDFVIRKVGIQFDEQYERVFQNHSEHGVRSVEYLKGAKLNIATSCFTKRAPSEPAIIFASESDPSLQQMTFQELDQLSNRVANALLGGVNGLSLSFGDAVGICMPMTPESIAVYLGIIKAGLTVVSIADSFAANEIETRMRLSNGKAIFTQDVVYRRDKSLPMFDRVLQSGPYPIIVLPGLHDSIHETVRATMREQDISWDTFLASGSTDFTAISCPSDHICNILFSSGTTGEPKAIPWFHATPIKCVVDGFLHQDIRCGEVAAWPTNIGWMMGPWIIFQLINGASLAVFSGNTGGHAYCKFVEEANVTMLGVVPSLVKAWHELNGTHECDWSGIRRFSSTGEASDVRSMLWLMSRAGYKPVIEYCGGTEIAGSFLSSTMVQPNVPSMFSTPVMGSNLRILNEAFQPTLQGEITLLPPALGLSTRLLNRDHHECYYKDMPLGPNGEVLRRHGDEIQAVNPDPVLRELGLNEPYYRAHGRCDDTMNLGGIKVSSVEIERVCNTVPDVLETAAIGYSPPSGGPARLVMFAVLKEGVDRDAVAAGLKSKFQNAIKSKLNPLFHLGGVVLKTSLPRTASNKVMRRVLRDEFATEHDAEEAAEEASKF